jgi:hypothetical protein
MGRDLAEQVQRMGGAATAKRSVCDGAFAQTPRLVEPAQQQSSPSQRVVRPDSTRRLTLDELLAFSEPRQRPAGVAELGQYPSGRRYGARKVEDYVPRSDHGDPALNQ